MKRRLLTALGLSVLLSLALVDATRSAEAACPRPNPIVESSGGSIVTSAPVICTTADGAIAVHATGTNSSITTTNSAVSTAGNEAPGVQADSGGIVTLQGGSVTTTGDGQSWGLFATGAGSQITATGVAVMTSGADDESGNRALGAYALNGASMLLTNTTISTSGGDAYGLEVGSGASATVSGGSVSTTANGALGLLAVGSGSKISVSGGTTITTAGDGAVGVLADSGATVTLGKSVVTTGGVDAYGAQAQNGSGVALTGGTVTVNGDGATGLSSIGPGSVVTATGTLVTTRGNLDPSNGQAIGALADGSGVLNLTDTAIVTTGAQAQGVAALAGGTATVVGGSISASGIDADGVLSNGPGSTLSMSGGTTIASSAAPSLNSIQGARVDNFGILNLTGVTISTSGVGVSGVGAATNGTANLQGVTVTTTAQGAHGLYVTGVGSTANLTGANSFTTGGGGAVGIYATAGGIVTATGQTNVSTGIGSFSYGAWAQGTGSEVVLNGPSSFAIAGSALALYATEGGVVTTTAALDVSVTNAGFAGGAEADTGGIVNIGGATTMTLNAGNVGLFTTAEATINSTASLAITTTGAGDVGAEAYGASARINLSGPTTITAPGASSYGIVSVAGGAITATGALNIAVADPSSVGALIDGANSTIVATGGGTIASTGIALELAGGAGQTATFDGFAISNTSGDLIFVDPASGTINLTNTIADAGAGNILDVSGGSAITFNANASTLTGAIQTDATSTTNVSLTNATTWNLTGSSTISNLSVIGSSIVYAAPVGGLYKTLTVGSYVGTGASLTLNAVLGGAGSVSDQLVINGGSATGTTTITVKNTGGVGGLTGPSGIPLVTATNGGTIAPGAFTLPGLLLVGGYQYQLESVGADEEALVSTPATSRAQATSSVTALATSVQSGIITNRVLGSILLGANEQVNCTSCGSGFAAIGSFDIGTHGRWTLSERMSLLAGVSFGEYSAQGVNVGFSPTVAAALLYDFVDWGRSRPFLEVGGLISPYQPTTYTRDYVNGPGISSGSGSTITRSAAAFARIGYVSRVTPIDEVAVLADVSQNWQQSDGYTEGTTADNPFAASVGKGVDSLYITRVGAQYTHLFAPSIELNVNAAIANSFGASVGSPVVISGFGPVGAPNPAPGTWLEAGGRIGYRLSDRLALDGFLLGTVGEPAGRTIHGGIGLRYAF